MRAKLPRPWIVILTAVIWCLALHGLPCKGASLVVTSLADSGPGSLRTAIAGANDGDVVTFSISGTITSLTGELLIGKSLDIVGPSPTKLAVSGNNASRVFNIAGGASVSLTGLTICNGHAHDGAAGTNSVTPGWPGDDGGGIYNSGTLALTNCVITRCRSGQGGAGFAFSMFPFTGDASSSGGPGGNGGGIYNAGMLTLAACTLSFNTNGSGGGGGNTRVPVYPGGAGGSGGGGGGIYDAGVATFVACTFASNSAGTGGAGGYGGAGTESGQIDGAGGGWGGDGGSGGGLCSQGSPTFIACTFAGNAGGFGGQGGAGGAGYSPPLQPIHPMGNGGTGGGGGTGGSGGGLYCPGFFQSIACTFTANAAGIGGNGGQGGRGGSSLGTQGEAGGQGGSGGNGGSGGGGGGATTWGSSSLQNVLAAQNASAAGGLAGVGGAGGIGRPSGSSGYPGSGGLDGSGPDLLGSFTSNGHNLIGLADGNSGFTDGVLGDIVGSGTPLNPLVGPLANNGGPTFTCALLAGSPALDTGDDTILDAPFGLTIDQRGLSRKSGSHVDIGALEVQWASNPICVAACISATDGAVQMTLTNIPGASLTILAATNPSLPVSTWTVLGPMFEVAPGQFQFIDPASTNLPQRIYRVRCP